MPLLDTVFTTKDEMIRKVGEQTLIDLADHDGAGVESDYNEAIYDAINQATEEISLTAGQRYAIGSLAESNLVRRWATTLACCFMFSSRGNPIPMSLQAEFDRIMVKLERLECGSLTLTGVNLIGDLRPSMSNRVVDRRFATRTVRTQRRSSTDASSKLQRHFDQDYGFQE